MPTASTVPFIVLSVILWVLTKGNLLSIILFMCIFQGASVANIGDQGVGAWVVLLIVGLILRGAAGTFRLMVPQNINWLALRLIIAFVGYAILSGILFPFVFSGVPVRSSRMPFGGPLMFGSANVSQICYLLAGIAVFCVALSSTHKERRSALEWYIYGCLVAAVFSAYQLLSAIVHVPFPASVIYSTPNHRVFYPAVSSSGIRLNSTFDEVSAMALYIGVGVMLQGWEVCTKPLTWYRSLSLIILIAALLCTESTIAYLSLILIAALLLVLSCMRFWKSGRASRGKVWLALLVGTAALLVVASTSVPAVVQRTFKTVVVDKDKSSSYRDRVETNVAAMETAKQTYYFGAGWESVRCSSLIFGLLATVGIGGAVLFVGSIAAQCKSLLSEKYVGVLVDDTHIRALLALCILIAGMAVGGNELTAPILWMLFAVGIAGPSMLEPSPVTSGVLGNT